MGPERVHAGIEASRGDRPAGEGRKRGRPDEPPRIAGEHGSDASPLLHEQARQRSRLVGCNAARYAHDDFATFEHGGIAGVITGS